MIPLRLTVKNFMCYRDNVPALDMEGLHVACLCGDNGHGKTALLDAITWALWGEARARTQEELIHQGKRDMAVELEFTARDQRYRVNRKYSRSASGRQGTTSLELQVASSNGDRPITENTVRETESRIREILHMDYDTFVNTAFLLQGRADMFTRSKPTERKERLAEVLDLSYYQLVEDRAKEKAKAVRDSIGEADAALSLTRVDVAGRPELDEKLAAVTATLAEIGPEVDVRRLRAEELGAQVDSLKGRRDDLNTLNGRLTAGREEMAGLQRQERNYEARVGEYEATLQRESEIREQFVRLEKERAELDRLDQASFQVARLDQEKAELHKGIAVQRERLSERAVQSREKIARELRPSAERLPEIEEGLRNLASEQVELDELEKSVRAQREEAQDVSARVRYLEQANAGLKIEMESTRKKFDMLDETDARCPLCRQPLGAEGQEHLRREYEVAGQEAKRAYRQQDDERNTLDLRHEQLVQQVAAQEKDLSSRRDQVQTRTATHKRDLEESRKAQSELGPAASELDKLEEHIKGEDFAREERAKLALVEAELSATGYDGEKHRQTREQVKALEPFAEDHRKLREAVERLPQEREALATARQMLDRRRHEMEEDERRREALAQDLESLPALESRLAQARSSYESLEHQQREARVQQGVVAEQLDSLARKAVQLRELERERDRLAKEKAVYDELAVAFGRNGIQALLIEQAIPQIQDDANELLGRLTDNRMFLKLQLQEGRKERRLGLPSEELEIKISDEIGTRSYETFSGGEAFRIDFALRIALSKLLARRSGAPLPILFIDEGFGSQDAAGQERLKEAIQSIQSDFQKIIVITHVEEVKDSFPSRIEVTKTESGSTFVVV